MKNYMDGGEAILEAFRKLKIDYILSSPGSEWSPVWEALVRQKTGNRAGPAYIDCWHETLAVNMATGYTLMTGRPQAVLVHAGVGLLQGSMGVHGALQSEVPMIVMSGESNTLGEDPSLPIEQQWYGGLSVGGIERFVENITKQARPVTSPFTLHEQVIRAGEMAQRTPKGPIYLNVALEHMLHDWTPPENDRDVPFAPRVEPHAGEVEKVASLLLAAKNPIIVAEQSGRDPAAFKALVELADLLAIPAMWGRVANFANFPTDHPLYLGVATYEHLKDADLILLVGGRAPWYPPHTKPTKGKIVSINENQFKGHMIYQQLHADAYLEGDIAAALQALTKSVRAAKIDAEAVKKRREHWTKQHDAFAAGLKAEKAKANGGGKAIDPLALIDTLAEVMPADTIYVDETILHGPTLRQHLPFTTPQSFFRGFGGLGQGLGTALGVKLAAPKTPGGVARRRRRLPLQPGDPGARRLKTARSADPDRDLQQQGLHGDAEGPRASLSRRRRRKRPHASGLAPQRLRLRCAGRAFRPARRARRSAGQAQGRAANRIEESAGRHDRHPQCDGQ